MKTLYVVRHAKSSWKDSSLADWERPLNKRGQRDAPLMGQRLAKRGIKPQAMVSSPATRAIKTAQAMAAEVGYPKKEIQIDDRLYVAGVKGIIKVIEDFDDDLETVMIFGHNPSFTELAGYLTGEHIVNLSTCAIYAMNFDIDSWREIDTDTGNRLFCDYPKKHQEK